MGTSIRSRPAVTRITLCIAGLASLIIALSMIPALAQEGSDASSPGFHPDRRVFRIQDRDGRPWVDRGTVGVRIDQAAAADLMLPDPLIADNQAQFALEDPSFEVRFDSRPSRGGATVEITVAAPVEIDRQVPYELVFFRNGKRLGVGKPALRFGATAEDGFKGLPPVLRVPARVAVPPTKFATFGVGLVAWVLFVTFALYRPFYKWRLSRNANVEKSRDWAFFWWWFFVIIAYGALIYWWLPRSLPFLVLLGLIGLMTLIRFIMSLRPRGEKHAVSV